MNEENSISAKTGAQARVELERRGESVAEFARRHGLSVSTVHQVLGGRSKARRGDAHRAAVLLGMKIGTLQD